MDNMYKPEGSLLGTTDNFQALSSPAAMERALQNRRICEGMCTLCDHEMRLHVALGEYEGIIEREEVLATPDGTPAKDIAIITRVGKPICFHILQPHCPSASGRHSACRGHASGELRCLC